MAVVLEPVEAGEDVGPPSASSTSTSTSTLGGRGKPPQLLRFTSVDAGGDDDDDDERKPSKIAATRFRDTVSPAEPNQKAPSSAALEEKYAAAHAAAAEHAKRCRARLVGWLFRPLLSDAFALASLTQALSMLGLGGGGGGGQTAAAVLVGDMAAWFLALPVGRAADATVGREAQNCPVLRWLKGVILAWASPSSRRPAPGGWGGRGGGGGGGRGGGEGSFLDGKAVPASVGTGRRIDDLFGDPVGRGGAGVAAADAAGGKGDIFGADPPSSTGDGDKEQRKGEEEEDEDVSDADFEGEEEELVDDDDGGRENLEAGAAEILRPMFEACAASQRLENASMLSVVTAEALAACREKLEESSLGQIAIGGGEAWACLARRLRLCLFVDHRLHWGMPTKQRCGASILWGENV